MQVKAFMSNFKRTQTRHAIEIIVRVLFINLNPLKRTTYFQ